MDIFFDNTDPTDSIVLDKMNDRLSETLRRRFQTGGSETRNGMLEAETPSQPTQFAGTLSP
jgi:hypothetical protein